MLIHKLGVEAMKQDQALEKPAPQESGHMLSEDHREKAEERGREIHSQQAAEISNITPKLAPQAP